MCPFLLKYSNIQSPSEIFVRTPWKEPRVSEGDTAEGLENYKLNLKEIENSKWIPKSSYFLLFFPPFGFRVFINTDSC